MGDQVGLASSRPRGPNSVEPHGRVGASARRRCDAVVIGTGPYGLATAAHLAASGLSVRTFGVPMES
jgi:NADPH-dependent 2,4-dienoyl-CoA reductase/sulfur reductase-like enzyme